LMFDGNNGVPNDSDLASIMEPGQTSPTKIIVGHRCAGTPMWLVNCSQTRCVKGLTDRACRHELGSFAWVLLYATLCAVNV